MKRNFGILSFFLFALLLTSCSSIREIADASLPDNAKLKDNQQYLLLRVVAPEMIAFEEDENLYSLHYPQGFNEGYGGYATIRGSGGIGLGRGIITMFGEYVLLRVNPGNADFIALQSTLLRHINEDRTRKTDDSIFFIPERPVGTIIGEQPGVYYMGDVLFQSGRENVFGVSEDVVVTVEDNFRQAEEFLHQKYADAGVQLFNVSHPFEEGEVSLTVGYGVKDFYVYNNY